MLINSMVTDLPFRIDPYSGANLLEVLCYLDEYWFSNQSDCRDGRESKP